MHTTGFSCSGAAGRAPAGGGRQRAACCGAPPYVVECEVHVHTTDPAVPALGHGLHVVGLLDLACARRRNVPIGCVCAHDWRNAGTKCACVTAGRCECGERRVRAQHRSVLMRMRMRMVSRCNKVIGCTRLIGICKCLMVTVVVMMTEMLFAHADVLTAFKDLPAGWRSQGGPATSMWASWGTSTAGKPVSVRQSGCDRVHNPIQWPHCPRPCPLLHWTSTPKAKSEASHWIWGFQR